MLPHLIYLSKQIKLKIYHRQKHLSLLELAIFLNRIQLLAKIASNYTLAKLAHLTLLADSASKWPYSKKLNKQRKISVISIVSLDIRQ